MERQRIVIFGGPDRTGKSTIAKAFANFNSIPYFKPTNQQWFAINDPGVFEKQTRWGEPKLLDFLRQTGHSAVMDRGFPCDWVYSHAMERETAWDVIAALDDGYAELGALLVFTLRKSYEGWADDADKRIDRAQLERLDWMYREYARGSDCRTLLLETDDQDLQGQVLAITHALEAM